jgi:hypothetical protein
MTFTELITKAVEMGIREVETCDAYGKHNAYKKEGAIAGFQKCLKLGSIEQFEAELDKCEKLEAKMREEKAKNKDKLYEDYWRQRSYTAQVEHVYGILCFASRYNKWPGHERLPTLKCNSTRAAMQYSRIVGVKY